jgi:hypothetical protein
VGGHLVLRQSGDGTQEHRYEHAKEQDCKRCVNHALLRRDAPGRCGPFHCSPSYLSYPAYVFILATRLLTVGVQHINHRDECPMRILPLCCWSRGRRLRAIPLSSRSATCTLVAACEFSVDSADAFTVTQQTTIIGTGSDTPNKDLMGNTVIHITLNANGRSPQGSSTSRVSVSKGWLAGSRC